MRKAFNIIDGVVVGLFGAMLALFFAFEVSSTFDIAKESKSFKEFTKNVQHKFPKQFPGKYSFIDLHGLFGRMVGRNESNKVVKDHDGMLFPQRVLQADVRGAAKSVIDFADFMKHRGIPFLYVQAPYKMDKSYDMLPKGGAQHYAYQNLDRFIALLRGKVDVIDLRNDLCATPDAVRKYFYRTDHHWNSRGGLLAARVIARSILLKIGFSPESYLDNLDESRWIEHSLPNWLLGSQGQRTGRFFTGLDALVWHTPKFPTRISAAEIESGAFYKGDFSDAHIRRKYIDERQNLYEDSAYNVYTGGNYPLVRMRNHMAPVKLKVLLFGDSYTRPIAPFLSTVFSEVDLVDPRMLVRERVAELALHDRPDCVVQLNNANVFPNRPLFSYGLPFKNKWWEWEKGDFLKTPEFTVDVKDPESEGTVLCPKLARGHHYEFSAESITSSGEEADCFEVLLSHLKKKQIWKRIVFDVAHGNTNGGFKWRFSVPEVGEWNLKVSMGRRLDGTCVPIKLHQVAVYDIHPARKQVKKRESITLLPEVAPFVLPAEKVFVCHSCAMKGESAVYISGECTVRTSGKPILMRIIFEDADKKALYTGKLPYSPKFGEHVFLKNGTFHNSVKVPPCAKTLTLGFMRWEATGDVRISKLKVSSL